MNILWKSHIPRETKQEYAYKFTHLHIYHIYNKFEASRDHKENSSLQIYHFKP
jgi:hypothetical protein